MSHETYCAIGGEVIPPSYPDTLLRYEITAWVRKRTRKDGKTQGGIHAVELHEFTGKVCCATHIEQAKRGISAGQMTLT